MSSSAASSSSNENNNNNSSSTDSVPQRVKIQENESGSDDHQEASYRSSSSSSPKVIKEDKKNNKKNNNHQDACSTSSSSFAFSSVTKSSPNANKSSLASSSKKSSNNNNNNHYKQKQNNGKIKFTAPLGRDPEKARRVLIEASDDALGVHRRTFVRRATMVIKLIVFVAFAATLAYLAQQIGSLSDLVSWLLSDAYSVRAIADGKPIQAGSVVSFTDGGVQQGHGPIVGVAVTALPCDPEPTASRLSYRTYFTNGNSTSSAIVSASATKNVVTYWMVDSSISDDNNNQHSASVDTSGENAGAAAHIALAGVGSSTLNGGSYTKSPFIVIAGAASGSSSVYLHLIGNPIAPSSSTTKSTVLASFFSVTSSTTDRSTAFAVSVVPPSSSSSTVDEVAVVGYVCGDDLCCIDLISWSTGAVLSGTDGPRIALPRCPTHAVHFPSTTSAAPNVSHVILPTVPVIVLTVNVTASSVKIGQILNLPITFAGSTTAMQAGNSTSAQIRVTTIPPPHSKKSVLISIALFDTFQVFQLFPSSSSGSNNNGNNKIFFINTQSATVRTRGLAGPVSLSGFVFSSTSSIASIYFREANNFQFMIQLSFINIGQASVPRMLPTVGGAEIEFLWSSDVWRHTMLVLRESPKYCGLRSVEWQGGLNFAGIAASTVQAGQSLDVLVGGMVRIFSNLIPGSGYSVGVNGSLVLEDDPLALQTGSERGIVGTAFSTTEMYLIPPR